MRAKLRKNVMKRMPNNFGTIYKLSGSRRRPWIARKLVGKVPDHDKKRMVPQYVTIGYYATRTEALNALAAVNADPSDPSLRRKTVADVYEAWSEEYYPKLRSHKHYVSAYRVLSGISDRPIADLKLADLQFVLKTSGKNKPVLKVVKMLLSCLYKYAVIHEIVPQQKADMIKYLDIGSENPNAITRRIFTPEERSAARNGSDLTDQITFFLLCTGLRVGEFSALKDSDIEGDLIHIRQAKTKAGIRTIPLPHGLTVPERRAPRTIEENIKKRYGHTAHDTRHTFTTLAVQAGIDQRIIDAIVGHVQSNNISLSVYTHIPPEALRDAMEKVLEIC